MAVGVQAHSQKYCQDFAGSLVAWHLPAAASFCPSVCLWRPLFYVIATCTGPFLCDTAHCHCPVRCFYEQHTPLSESASILYAQPCLTSEATTVASTTTLLATSTSGPDFFCLLVPLLISTNSLYLLNLFRDAFDPEEDEAEPEIYEGDEPEEQGGGAEDPDQVDRQDENVVVGGDPSAAAAAKTEKNTVKSMADKRVPNDKRTTTPYMTKYEKARVLGTRALQIR
jgi:hypothetical protein